MAQLVKNPPAMWATCVGKSPWRRESLPTPVFWPGECSLTEELAGYSPWKESTCKNLPGLIPGSRSSPGEGLGYPFHYSWASLVAQMVKKSLPAVPETWVQFLGWEDPLEEGMATHSTVLAWRIPWTEEPCGLQFIGLPRVGHD